MILETQYFFYVIKLEMHLQPQIEHILYHKFLFIVSILAIYLKLDMDSLKIPKEREFAVIIIIQYIVVLTVLILGLKGMEDLS